MKQRPGRAQRLSMVCVLFAAVLTTACGGGGGSDAPNVPSAPPIGNPPTPPTGDQPASPPADDQPPSVPPPAQDQPPPVPPPSGDQPPSVPPPAPVLLATYRVGDCPAGWTCAGKPMGYNDLFQNILKPGDVVDIYPSATDLTPRQFTRAGTSSQPIVIRGVTVNGVRPRIRGGASQGTRYASLSVLGAHHMVIENLDITNGINRRQPDGSIDTKRYDTHLHCVRIEADDVTLRDVRVFDCPNNGVFGADGGTGSVTLERVEITRSGCTPGVNGMQCPDGMHPVYVATDGEFRPESRLRISDSVIHRNHAGVTIKSRARRLELHHNWVLLSNSNEVQAVGVFGHDAPAQQASADRPVHADIVGNVFLVEGPSTMANAIVRAGGDFEPEEYNAGTFGRVRLVSNTFVVSGAFGKGQRNRPIVRFFGHPEGLMAMNNVAVVADDPSGRVVLLHEDGEKPPQWAAPDQLPRVLLSHNHLPVGSIAWSDRIAQGFAMDSVAPAGFVWSHWLAGPSGLLGATGSLASVTPDALRLRTNAALAGRGTLSTNPGQHPWDPQRPFAVPDAMPLPLREPAQLIDGVVTAGALRNDGAAPTPGALP
jgi:hypothetical protein